jgi:hypothetical protein
MLTLEIPTLNMHAQEEIEYWDMSEKKLKKTHKFLFHADHVHREFKIRCQTHRKVTKPQK